jgi:Ca2+-transporting ATPase
LKEAIQPYQESVEEVVRHFSTNSSSGLSDQEVVKRLETFGENKLPEKPRPTLLSVFFDQFKNPLIYILLIAASIIFFTGNHVDAFILSGVLLFNAVMGTIQEGKTQNLLDSLRRSIKTSCVVVRDHKHAIINGELLVPGDIVVLQEGDRIPADLRIIQSSNLVVDEAILTGESSGVSKTTLPLQEELPVHDQTNMSFKGTFVISGSGKGVVVATGADTAIGKLQKVVEEIQTETPLKKELDTLSYQILIFILIVCVALFGIGFSYGKSFAELLAMLTALFICVIPEGLPVVLTLILVTGAQRMAKKDVLVKKLRGVDSLGRTEVAVIDKTGTLTRNELMVSRVYTTGSLCEVSGEGYFVEGTITCDKDTGEVKQALDTMATASLLLNRAEVKYEKERKTFLVEGDPIEAALGIFGEKYGFNVEKLEREYELLFEIPFNPSYGYHAIFFHYQQGVRAFIIGSPESLISCCSVSEQDTATLSSFLEEGLRTVAAGYKDFSEQDSTQEKGKDTLDYFKSLLASGVEFLGFFGLQDTLRLEVPPIVEQVRGAGLRVVMATGDHKKTALFVAKKAGIFKEGDEVIDGSEFRTLSDAELLRRLDKTTVYSRVTPEDKLRLIGLFHKMGKVVAMTGDGVNDAPSLVAADVGIAMGGIGTEVAKDASDVILLDDSFANVVRAIEQGRHIFYTLHRVILYFFATNLGEVFVVLFALVLNYPLPILAAQILWLNLVTDGFLDLALAMEPEEKGLLERKWLRRGSRITDLNLFLKTIYMALPMGIGAILMFRHYYLFDLAKARTITLITMALYQWFNAWNCRSETKSLLSIGLFTNKWLLLATAFVGLLQVLVVKVPILQTIFHTVPISAEEFGVIILVTAPLLLIEELRKLFVRLFFVRTRTGNP